MRSLERQDPRLRPNNLTLTVGPCPGCHTDHGELRERASQKASQWLLLGRSATLQGHDGSLTVSTCTWTGESQEVCWLHLSCTLLAGTHAKCYVVTKSYRAAEMGLSTNSVLTVSAGATQTRRGDCWLLRELEGLRGSNRSCLRTRRSHCK